MKEPEDPLLINARDEGVKKHFELFKQVLDLKKQCKQAQKDIKSLEGNEDLVELYQQ